ncbi:MAG: hypothetical protein R3E69_00940 [Steroidobacteraceae bacterium]
MPTDVAQFKQRIGAELAAALGRTYAHLRSRDELREITGDDRNVIIISTASKYSPFVSVAFYFGRNFAKVRDVEKLQKSYKMPYHIQQYSYNRRQLKGLDYVGPDHWEVDIRNPSDRLAEEMTAAIRGMAVPFFDRFATLTAARDAIANDDPWCFGGSLFWNQLLKLDLALGDLDHFQEWSSRLKAFDRNQADEQVRKWRALPCAV